MGATTSSRSRSRACVPDIVPGLISFHVCPCPVPRLMSISPVGVQSVFSRKHRYVRQWLYLLTDHPDPGLPKIKPNRRPSTGYRSRPLVHSESNLTFALRHICTSNLSFPKLYWCFEVYGRILSHAWRVIRRVVWGPGPLLSLSQALSVGPTAACESEPRRLVRNGWG